MVKELGPAAFSAYRRLTVTAYSTRDRAHAKLLWRTVMAEDGFEYGVDRTIPALVEAGQEYYGRSLTQLAVADCTDFSPPLGSHIPEKPCAVERVRLGGDVVRRPQVTTGPLVMPSTPAPAPGR